MDAHCTSLACSTPRLNAFPWRETLFISPFYNQKLTGPQRARSRTDKCVWHWSPHYSFCHVSCPSWSSPWGWGLPHHFVTRVFLLYALWHFSWIQFSMRYWHFHFRNPSFCSLFFSQKANSAWISTQRTLCFNSSLCHFLRWLQLVTFKLSLQESFAPN